MTAPHASERVGSTTPNWFHQIQYDAGMDPNMITYWDRVERVSELITSQIAALPYPLDQLKVFEIFYATCVPETSAFFGNSCKGMMLRDTCKAVGIKCEGRANEFDERNRGGREDEEKERLSEMGRWGRLVDRRFKGRRKKAKEDVLRAQLKETERKEMEEIEERRRMLEAESEANGTGPRLVCRGPPERPPVIVDVELT